MRGRGRRTLVQEAVELKLLDQFGGCLGCHRKILLPASRLCDLQAFKSRMQRVRNGHWKQLQLFCYQLKVSRWLGNDAPLIE